MRASRVVWSAVIGGGTALELWAVFSKHEEWTLSPHLRWALRCGTRHGNALTAVGIGGGAAWLAHHLQTLPPPRD